MISLDKCKYYYRKLDCCRDYFNSKINIALAEIRWARLTATIQTWYEITLSFFFFFIKFGFTSCKAEQPLQAMELQEKKETKLKLE